MFFEFREIVLLLVKFYIMEDFIIILIGFAVMLYSAYSKNKKTNQQKKANSADKEFDAYSEPDANQEDDLLENFFGYDQKQNDPHPYEQRNYTSENNAGENKLADNLGRIHSFNKETISETIKKKEGGTLREEGIKASKQENYKKPVRRKRNTQKRRMFNLRNAVIYSEILNRKY